MLRVRRYSPARTWERTVFIGAAIVSAAVVGVAGAAASSDPGVTAAGVCTELPIPAPSIVLRPVALGVTRPELPLPIPPAPPRSSLADGAAPLPAFVTALKTPMPAARDPGAFACAFMALRGAAGLADCGVHRVLQGDLAGARQSLEQSLALEAEGAPVPRAALWLGVIALREGRWAEAGQRYRGALLREPEDSVASDAALGLAWVRLQGGDSTGALEALDEVPRAPGGSVSAHVAGLLEGVALLRTGRAGQALAALDAVVADRPAEVIAEEVTFWRGVALSRLGDPDAGTQILDRFLADGPPTSPLRADAAAQTGWTALERGAPGEALRRFTFAERMASRAEIRAQIQAGLVRSHLALGDAVRAMEIVHRLAADVPGDPLVGPTLIAVADAAIQSGATEDGLAGYRLVLGLPAASDVLDYARYRLGEGLERAQRLDEARREYVQLRDRGKDETIAQRAAYRLGLLALRTGDPASGRREGEALLRAGTLVDLRESALLLAAEGAAREGDANRAAALFRAALGEFPGSPLAARIQLALGWARWLDGDARLGLQEWRRAFDAGDSNTRLLAALAIAEVTLSEGPEPEALEALRAVSIQAASPPFLLPSMIEAIALDHGILAGRAGAWEEAVRILEAVAPRFSDPSRRALALEALAMARYRLGQHGLAEREFRQAVQLAPTEPSGWLGLGLTALLQHRLADAEEALTRALVRGDPETAASAAYGLMLVAVQQGDDAVFRARAAAFVDGQPAHLATPIVLCSLASTAAARGDREEAARWVTRLAREHPGSEQTGEALRRLVEATADQPALRRQVYEEILALSVTNEVRREAWLGLADAALAGGDAAVAQRAVEAFLREAPGADPRIPGAFIRLVGIHDARGRHGLAIRTVEALIARFPDDPLVPLAELIRGRLLVAEGRWSEAWDSLDTARVRGAPAVSAEAHFWLGETLRLRGQHEAAIAVYLGATSLYPDTPWASRGLQGAAQSYLARNMPRDAAAMLRRLATEPNAEPALARWARDTLTRLEARPGELRRIAPEATTMPRGKAP